MKNILVLLLFLSLSRTGLCWDTDDFEIFDAVEEINRNFYELMGISQDAKLSEIKKAYRTLSKQLHPDKSDAPDAEVQFRNLVTAYEILRDEGKRERYNRVLVEGIPDWRSPIFYYRRARKMSMLEISIILIVVISIAQYLMAWGSYLDKRHTLEDLLLRKFKVRDKKKKKVEDSENISFINEQLDKIEKPKWYRILPIQTVQFVIFLFLHGPGIVKNLIADAKEKKKREEEMIRKKEENERRQQEEEEERERKKAEQRERRKAERKRVREYAKIQYASNAENEKEEAVPVITGGPWTDEEFSELARLMAKFPGGTADRWEKIAAQLGRTVYEVTKMSNIVKDRLANREPAEVSQPKIKQKTRKGEEQGDMELGSDEAWNASQQKALEKALKKYPKGTEQRWDKIANCVPEKSKEECMMRFKFLAEKIKKKREEEAAVNEENDDNVEENGNEETQIENTDDGENKENSDDDE